MQLVIWPFHAARRQASTTRVLHASSVNSMLGKNSLNRTCTHKSMDLSRMLFPLTQKSPSLSQSLFGTRPPEL